MTQNNGNAYNGKYKTLAVGWLKQHQTKGEYISAVANGKNAEVKLLAELPDGTTVAVNSFAVFFTESKKNEKQPDVRFVATIE